MMFLESKTISISILNVKNLEEFLKELKEICIENNIHNVIIHFDVMDNMFVKNNGIDIEKIKLVKEYGFFADVHLMVEKPLEYIDKCVEYGADNITIHYEINNLYKTLEYLNNIKNKLNRQLTIGIAVNPKTYILNVFNYINLCDMILLMSVEPGKRRSRIFRICK
jgi:ribulose-phosphate 3-epimerase